MKTITIGDTKLLAEVDWHESDAKSAFRYHLEVNRDAKASKRKFGFKNYRFESDAQHAQHFLTDDKKLFDDGALVGAGFLAKSIHPLSPTLHSSVFVYTTKTGGDEIVVENEYWVAVVSDIGYIYSSDDRIVSGDDELRSIINQYSAISHALTVYTIEDDVSAYHLLSLMQTDDGEASVEENEDAHTKFTIKTLSEKEVSELAADSQTELKTLYRESPIKVKKLGVGVAVAAALSSLVAGYKFYEQLPAQSYFSDEASTIRFSDVKKRTDEMLDGYQSSKHWNDTSYAKDTVETFNNYYLSNKLTSKDVGKIMFYIERTLPLYAVEWKLDNIEMREGQFYITYEKIPKSKGAYVILDMFFKELNKKIDVYDILPIPQDDDPDVRVYRVLPKIKVGLTGEAETLASQRRSIASFNAQKEKQLTNANKLSSEWLNADYLFDEMPFFDRYVLNSGADLMDNAKVVASEIEKEMEKLDELLKLDYNNISERVTPSWVSAKKVDFITLMQTDSLFTWTLPVVEFTFPSKEDIESKNYKPKAKKSRGSRGKSIKAKKVSANIPSYGAAINAYSVKISTNSSDEEGSVKSYGILDLQHLMEKLNVPSVQVESVNYSKSDEQWTVVIRFYEKTSEFDKYLM